MESFYLHISIDYEIIITVYIFTTKNAEFPMAFKYTLDFEKESMGKLILKNAIAV